MRETIQEVIESDAPSNRDTDYEPFKRFANVRRVEIILKPMDLLMERFGVKKRKSKVDFAYHKYSTDPLNRYLKYQLYRLRKHDTERAY